ncbi:Phosphodiest-domain-containing protein [Leucogyrophana mollusca]|uniref:Phosphodiest-domain-containing protein n=1 Tax=Leucogyrophana mollusca TaxID=85980 RepID=A0ACB8BQR8_9AGAM|nr:Phosphodiest-domain-containing protein [Leucogyrophana mollusca]
MAHSNGKQTIPPPDDEERQGLLSAVDAQDNDQEQDLQDKSESAPHTSNKWKLLAAATGIAVVAALGSLALWDRARTVPRRTPHFDKDTVFNNGTHDFKRTVLMVSIDGLRADYLDRGLTPHLLDISKKGLRAKYMKPIFPTLTFPNHWSLMTGLYAESHGIIGNNFWDPATNTEFFYNRIESCWNASWWFGEPMWETAERAGIKTANLMWPGPPHTTSGASSTYFVPWRDHVPLSEKHDQLLAWIDMPFEERPQLLLAYEPSLDQAGHATGPGSARINSTLLTIDRFARTLQASLASRNLTDIVDVIFVSDHGMADTSHPEWVYVDDSDILGEEWGLVEHRDGWPSMGLRFAPTANTSHILEKLLVASQASASSAPDSKPKFDVYTTPQLGFSPAPQDAAMPSRYHFAANERIAPIYVVPRMGYALTSRKDGNEGMTLGNHGYDNDELSMRAMFVAHGPFSTGAKVSFSAGTKDAWHSTEEDAYVINGFENVQIYGLVMKLLGIEDRAAPTNGTEGFWDAYF